MIKDNDSSIQQVVDQIEELNQTLASFWKKADGWAPLEAANLLSKSRLDWQVSLSSSLRLWLREPPNQLSDGELILAWVNLGSLIEGSLKLFLSVYYNDFRNDLDRLKAAGAYDSKKQEAKSPDGLKLESLRKFVLNANIFEPDGNALVKLVQDRRNAVHSFKHRPIGDEVEFQNAIRDYLKLLWNIEGCLPYP